MVKGRGCLSDTEKTRRLHADASLPDVVLHGYVAIVKNLRSLVSVLALLLAACGGNGKPAPLPQRAYVWQRDWNAPVAAALERSKDTLSGCVVLAAEIEWKNGAPHPIKPRLDHAALRAYGKPVGLAMRIAPHAGPFAENDATAKFLCDTALALITEAKANQLTPAEFQCDFDCAQKKLAGYAHWVRALKRAVAPVPLVITTLPSWLNEPEFPKLVSEASRYVLQVHSVSSPLGDAHTMICDPALARKWVAHAEKIALPFEIALPTYRSLVGYSPEGKLLGTLSDGTRPTWPPGTLVREYATDANEMAGLISEWNARPPASCRGIIWYRLPVDSDRNNWTWTTLRAVSSGHCPRISHTLLVNGSPLREGDTVSLADITLLNSGEGDTAPHGSVGIRWEQSNVRATAEALPGWTVSLENERALFAPLPEGSRRLPPGESRAIGWLRLEPATPVYVETIR